MADGGANMTWSSWTLTTKIGVGIGLAVAAVLVVLLNLPR